MPDTDPGATPVDEGATPNSGTTTPPPKSSATDDSADLGESGKAALDKEREARRDAEKRAKTFEKELQKFQDAARTADEATLSEQEKLRRRVAELETERDVHATAQREQAIRMAAVTAAARLGFADPEDAFALLDREAIEFDDAGTPKNVSRLLTDLLKAKPYLGAAHARPMGSADGGARAGAPTLQEQAAEAAAKGDWKTSISAKNRQLVEQAQKR